MAPPIIIDNLKSLIKFEEPVFIQKKINKCQFLFFMSLKLLQALGKLACSAISQKINVNGLTYWRYQSCPRQYCYRIDVNYFLQLGYTFLKIFKRLGSKELLNSKRILNIQLWRIFVENLRNYRKTIFLFSPWPVS